MEASWFLIHRGKIYAMSAQGKWLDCEEIDVVADLSKFLANHAGARTLKCREDSAPAPEKEIEAAHEIVAPHVVWRPSNKFSSRNGTAIDRIVMHYTTTATAEQAIITLTIGDRVASAHYVIDRDGTIYQLVDTSKKAWHAPAVNSRSIGIEHVARPGEQLTEKQSAASAGLCAYLCKVYKIKPEHITGHKFTGQATACPAALFGPGETEAELRAWVEKNVAPLLV